MGFLSAGGGPVPLWPRVDDSALGREAAVFVMLGSAMVICALLAFAVANIFVARAQSRWLTAYSRAVLLVTSGLAIFNSMRLNDVVSWAEQVLPILPGPR
jgi:hypothetical protein